MHVYIYIYEYIRVCASFGLMHDITSVKMLDKSLQTVTIKFADNAGCFG